MNRKLGLVLVLLLTTGAIFATGEEEVSSPRGDHPMISFLENKETLILTGEVTLANRRHPELKSAGKVYYLMVPPVYFSDEVSLNDGDIITIEGIVFNSSEIEKPEVEDYRGRGRGRGHHMGFGFMEEGNYVIVTKATIDGREYDLSELRGNGYFMKGGRMGGRHGMMFYNKEDETEE